MNIPLENYTDGVRQIITSTSVYRDFKDLICTLPDEDVKTALEILKNHNMANGKIKELEKELRIRERPEPEIIKDKWTNDFKREWNEMRKAAGK